MFNKPKDIGEPTTERQAQVGDAVLGRELSTTALNGLVSVDESRKGYDNSVLTADGPAPLSATHESLNYPLPMDKEIEVTDKTGEFDPNSLKKGQIGYIDPNDGKRKSSPAVLK